MSLLLGSIRIDENVRRASLLSAELIANIKALASGKTGGAYGMNVFTTENHSTSTYVRNPNLWCKSLESQLTGIAAYKNTIGCYESFGVTMITQRHFICCKHAHPWSSTQWVGDGYAVHDCLTRFVKTDGTVVNKQQIGQYESDIYDISVGLLNSNVGAGIYIMPIAIAPANMTDYQIMLLEATQGYGRDTHQIPPAPASDYPQYNDMMFCVSPSVELYNDSSITDFKYNIYPGDSGTPLLALKNDLLSLYGLTGADFVYSKQVHLNHLIELCDTDAVTRGVLVSPTGMTVTTVNLAP